MNQADYIDYCEDAYSYISDASKGVQGVRSRFDWSEFTLVQLCMQGDRWSERVLESIQEDKIREDEAIAEFESNIAATIEIGAGDRETAIRWIKDAFTNDDEDGYFDERYFLYHHELPYSYDINTGSIQSILRHLN